MIVRLVSLPLALGLLSGCGDERATSGATDLAERFHQAIAARDFTAACDLLSPEVRRSLDDCPKELAEAGIGDPAGEPSSEVFGQNGVVRWPGEAVFVSRFPGGWKVIAAGCRWRDSRPYDCSVSGG